ncbi:MAG: hypothetical protein ACK6BG_05330 [Cyanobacteriota bacterium]
MTLLLLDANGLGIVSSRLPGRRPAYRRHWIERACHADLAFRVLTGNQQPDHSRISGFRLPNLDALSGLFVQILRLLIVAVGVSNQPPQPDVEHLEPMLERTIANTCACSQTFLADADTGSQKPNEPQAAQTQKGRELYAKRKTTPEPVFGQTKEFGACGASVKKCEGCAAIEKH